MSLMLHAALCLFLGQATGEAMRVDWSVAIGRDTAIAETRADYVRMVNSGGGIPDTLFTSDAMVARGNGHVATGAAELVTPSRAFAANPSGVVITLVPRRFAISGASGAETGTFLETGGRGNHMETVEGLYVTIYSRGVDGRWQIAMEVRTTGSRAPLAVW